MTIRELAKMAGVSPTTVSFVLNGKGNISQDTRERVRTLIEQTGFRPSMSSRRLYLRRSFQVALLLRPELSPFDDLFYLECTRGVYARAKEAGYNLLFAEYDGELPEPLLNRDVDGVIGYQSLEEDARLALEGMGIPYVVADADRGCLCAGSRADYRTATRRAARCLTDAGHKRVAFVGPAEFEAMFADEYEGYGEAMREAGLEPLPALRARLDDGAREAAEAVARAEVTGVVCPSDRLCVALLQKLTRAGVRVPEDVSLVSVDDTPLTRIAQPALTAVRIDAAELGRVAMDALCALIRGEPAGSTLLNMEEISPRESVRDLRKADTV